jgi:hypothetical protein
VFLPKLPGFSTPKIPKVISCKSIVPQDGKPNMKSKHIHGHFHRHKVLKPLVIGTILRR